MDPEGLLGAVLRSCRIQLYFKCTDSKDQPREGKLI
jgi:hypothetical protein